MGFRKSFKGIRFYVGSRRASVSVGGLNLGTNYGRRARRSKNYGGNSMPWATSSFGVGCLKFVAIAYLVLGSIGLPVWAVQQNVWAGLLWTVSVLSGWTAVALWAELRRRDRESV